MLENRSLIGIDPGAPNISVAQIYQDEIEQIEKEERVDSDNPSDLVVQIERFRDIDRDNVESIGMVVAKHYRC